MIDLNTAAMGFSICEAQQVRTSLKPTKLVMLKAWVDAWFATRKTMLQYYMYMLYMFSFGSSNPQIAQLCLYWTLLSSASQHHA